MVYSPPWRQETRSKIQEPRSKMSAQRQARGKKKDLMVCNRFYEFPALHSSFGVLETKNQGYLRVDSGPSTVDRKQKVETKKISEELGD